MAIHFDQGRELGAILARLPAVFGIGLPRLARSGYGRAVNVTDRMIGAMSPGRACLFFCVRVPGTSSGRDPTLGTPEATPLSVTGRPFHFDRSLLITVSRSRWTDVRQGDAGQPRKRDDTRLPASYPGSREVRKTFGLRSAQDGGQADAPPRHIQAVREG